MEKEDRPLSDGERAILQGAAVALVVLEALADPKKFTFVPGMGMSYEPCPFWDAAGRALDALFEAGMEQVIDIDQDLVRGAASCQWFTLSKLS